MDTLFFVLFSYPLLVCFCPFQVVNKPDSHGGSLDWTKICEKSSKVITFIDLAGHEKYLKTTVFGMTGHLPDFCMLMVREETALGKCDCDCLIA